MSGGISKPEYLGEESALGSAVIGSFASEASSDAKRLTTLEGGPESCTRDDPSRTPDEAELTMLGALFVKPLPKSELKAITSGLETSGCPVAGCS